MQPIAADLDAGELRAMAGHYARQQVKQATSTTAVNPDAIARGRRLAGEGDGLRRIPACVACHGPGADGNRNPMYPRLDGQYAGYIELQLHLFRDGGRGGTVNAPIMERAATGLSERDIADLAAYYASLPAHAGNVIIGE